MKSLFVVNARSGPRRNLDLVHVFGDEEVHPCEKKEDLDDVVARALREHYDVLFAVGGDGTVHEVAKRLIGTDLALGVIPTGSGNGFARHLGLPLTPHAALKSVRDGRVVTIDTAVANGAPFVGVMGAGFDAVVAYQFADSRERGLRTYVRKGLAAYASYRPATYEIEVDGTTMTRQAFVVAVANASQYGNNARIAPVASMQDGLLDLVTVHDVSIFSALPLLIRLFNGTLNRSHRAQVHQGKHIVIRRDADGPAHLDGEPVMMSASLDVKIVPDSLRVLVPRSAARI